MARLNILLYCPAGPSFRVKLSTSLSIMDVLNCRVQIWVLGFHILILILMACGLDWEWKNPHNVGCNARFQHWPVTLCGLWPYTARLWAAICSHSPGTNSPEPLQLEHPFFLIITVIALWTVCFAACHSYVPPAISCCLLLLLLIFGKVVVLSSPSSCLTKVNVPCPMQEEEKNTDKQLWYQCRCSFLEVLQVPQRNCRQLYA